MPEKSKLKDSRKLNVWYSEDEFFDYGVTKHIGVSAAIVYFALCRHADRNGKAFPSVELLVQECGLSNRVVAKSSRTLKQFGLIEIERNKHQHNIYYVQSVKKAITLNKWEKIANVKSTFAKKQVTIRHEASDDSSREQVTIRHEASDDSSHEGLKKEGHTIEGLKKEGKNTHTDRARSRENENSPKKNVCVLDELNDSEKTAWEWAQKHDFWKGRITNARQLRANLAKGKAFRVQFEQAHPTVKPVNGKEAKRVWKKMKIDDCPYCDKRGVIDMREPNGDHFEMDRCPHNHEVVKELAIKKQKMVFSAKPGYEDPADLKALEKKRAEKAREHARKAKDCPYCDERGVINMCDPNNDRFLMDRCPHDPEIIKEMVTQKQKIIKSAKPGYEDPAGLKKPKITPAEKARTREILGRMIGGFQPA